MNKHTLLPLATALLLTLPVAASEIVAQKLTWEGSMPAKTHHGVIQVKSVDAEVGANGVPSSLKVVVDMTSITDTDLKKEKSRKKLEGHLKSEAFFHVSQYPEASFTLKEWEEGKATGVLSIRGVEVERTMPLTLTKTAEGTWNLKGKFTFDRQKFNVNYQNRGWLGFLDAAKNKIIADEVHVGVHITFKD